MTAAAMKTPQAPPSKAWKVLGLLWLGAIGLYALLVLLPVRFTFLDTPLTDTITVGELAHFSAFFFLGFVFPLAFAPRILVFSAPVALTLLNVVLEFLQMHVPNRRFSELDVAAGILGCLAGTLLGWVLRWILLHRQGRGA